MPQSTSRRRRSSQVDRDHTRLAGNYPLTVIVPVYNPGETLARCLEALLQNRTEDLQILLIDDGSTDGAIESALAQFPGLNIEVIRTERRSGPAAARNYGAARALHAHLLFLDADVELPPDAILWIRESLDLYSHRPEVAGVLGSYSEENPLKGFFTQFKNLSTCYLYEVTETLSPFLHTPIFCVNRLIFESNGGFDDSLARGEDFKLGVTLGNQGYRFVIDRRIRGVHLKAYTGRSVLLEDWRRIRDLKGIRLSPQERRFSYRAHRWNRLLALATSVLSLVCMLFSPLWNWLLLPATLCLLLFFLANLGLLSYMLRKRGVFFAAASAGFLYLEMLWAVAALIFSRRNK